MSVSIRLLGGFAVEVDDAPLASAAWRRRHAAALVKLLALAPKRRLHRDQVIDALWPGISVDEAAPRLHKAAHYARRGLGDTDDAVVLRSETVALLPDQDVHVDAAAFREAAEEALRTGRPEAAEQAIAAYTGPLLPDDLYESWVEEPRERFAALHRDLLRNLGDWERLIEVNPLDEHAHLELIRETSARGDVRAALRQFERMDQALRRELGTLPSPEAQQLRGQLRAQVPTTSVPDTRTKLFGRKEVGDLIRQGLERAEQRHGNTLLLTGAPGVGKSAVLELAEVLAGQRGWRVGKGTASEVEGPWPYAPVLEALSDLCRRHPALLDGLADEFRSELERALSGQDVPWTGESGHQRLFVAAAELMRLAAAGRGLLLVVDDVHEADEASLRLLHYLSRCAVSEPVLIVVAHRKVADEPLQEMTASLLARGMGQRIDIPPLSESVTRRLLGERFPDLDDDAASRIWAVSGGLPFAVLELGRAAQSGQPAELSGTLPVAIRQTFQRLALLGSTFSTDELLAVAGTSEADAYHQLEVGVSALLVEPAEPGYRFRHALVREGLLDTMSPHELAAARREAAERFAVTDAPPARVAHYYLAAGLPSRAAPYVARAVETAGALGAYRDGLALIDGVRDHAGPDDLPHLLARRGDLLMALGDPEAITAYREALPITTGTEHRMVLARLARSAGFAGDLETARAALDGLEPEEDAADGPILLARGHLAYFTGDIDEAWDIASSARGMLGSPDDPWQLVDLVTLQGLIAHHRGEWFERFQLELRRTQGHQQMVTAIFDAHLCVAEYLLYGPTPYAEVIGQTEVLRRNAEKAGALRGVAFATALIGEAALLKGDLELAERELQEAVDLHRDIDAPAGEAHGLQRLAEVRLARGNAEEARKLLQRALPLARWSVMSMHLLQRIYGTLVQAAPNPLAARAMVDQAEATLGERDRCSFCLVTLAVPAAIACARVGDLAEARRQLELAESSVARWKDTAWDAAVVEARAHIVATSGDLERARALLVQAQELFAAAGHVLEAKRCRDTELAVREDRSVASPVS
jgi:DNA-binding SARP family transcriptional activator/predicted negative regulator of RcsB-dependent stress response